MIDLIVGSVVSCIVVALISYLVYEAVRDARKSKRGDGIEVCDGCGRDLRDYTERCPECGVPTRHSHLKELERLRDDWPSSPIDPRVPGMDEVPVPIFTTRDATLAGLLQQHLEARGIACRVPEPKQIGRYGRNDLYTPFEVMVWTLDEDAAKRIIAHLCPARLMEESARLAAT